MLEPAPFCISFYCLLLLQQDRPCRGEGLVRGAVEIETAGQGVGVEGEGVGLMSPEPPVEEKGHAATQRD